MLTVVGELCAPDIWFNELSEKYVSEGALCRCRPFHLRVYTHTHTHIISFMGQVAQSVWRLTTGWTVRDRIPVGMRFSACPDQPWGPTSLL